MDFRRFLSALKARNVVRVAGVYTVSAWGVFQVAKTVFETFELAKWVSALTLLLLVLGLPVAMALSWAFELGPHGAIRRTVNDPDQPKRKMNWMDWGALAAIATVSVVFVATAVGLAGSLRDDAAAGLTMGASNKSVAVLPFANFSNAADSEYFADGLTEEVINSLAQVPELKVAGRTSTFYFKGKNQDIREIGKKLNVAHVVEGSVRRSGDRLRVTCQLVSVKDGYHLWSETYDRTMDDAFAIQTEIADGVAEALKVELRAGGGQAQVARRDPEAYRLEVIAKGQLRHKGKAQVLAAQAIYKRLIELEPQNAQVHADYAYTTAYLVQNHLEGDFRPAVRDAEAEIAKALELDPRSSAAYVAKGMVNAIRFIREGRQSSEAEAEAAYKKAVDLAPRDPEALSLYGDYIAGRRPAEATIYLRRALEIDPLDRIANNALAGSLFATNQLVEAEQRYRANIELFPEYVDSKQQLADLLTEQGKLDQAVVWLRMAAAPETDPSASLQLANIYYNLGLRRDAENAMDVWRRHPVVAPIVDAIKLIIAGDFGGMLHLSQARMAEPDADPLWHSAIVLGASALGQYDLAREQLLITSPELFEPKPVISPGLAHDAMVGAYAIAQTGDNGQARRVAMAVLTATEPRPGLRQMNARRISRAQAYVMLGDKERALAELRAAYDNGYRQLYDLDSFMRLDAYPNLAPLRADPRFRELIGAIEADNNRLREALLSKGQPPVQVAEKPV